jgi:hypothetical protein
MQRPSGREFGVVARGTAHPDAPAASASRLSTSSNEAIATWIWPRSGFWVAIFCSQRLAPSALA